jgi:outer membrane receptor protein involved in Fe transport
MTVGTDIFERVGVEPGAQLTRSLGTLDITYTDPESDITFQSLTGYVEDRVRTAFDVSYSGHNPLPAPPSQNGAFFQIDRDDSSVFTQEFRVTTSQKERLRATAGVYFFRQESDEIANFRVVPTSTSAVVPGDPGASLQPNLNGLTVQLQSPAINLTENRVRNIAIFGGVDYDVTDRLTLGVEARYAEDNIKQKNFLNDGLRTPDVGAEETFKAVTPRVTARYRLTDDIGLYANVAGGTKPGNFNPSVPDESFRNVDEETLIAYEIGAKTQWFDRRLTANLAVYYNDIDDQQLTVNVEISGQPTSILANAGKTEVWGVELETFFEITDNWTGGASYAWTDSEITERISVDEAELRGWDGQQSTLAQFGDVSGRESPRIPENQFALFTRYEIPFSWGDIYVGGDFTFEGSRWSQEHNLIETGDRSVLGARIGARVGNWDFNVWARNLTDDDAPVDILRYIDRRSGTLPACGGLIVPPGTCGGPVPASSSPRGFALTPQQPRQYGATLNYRFGRAQ